MVRIMVAPCPAAIADAVEAIFICFAEKYKGMRCIIPDVFTGVSPSKNKLFCSRCRELSYLFLNCISFLILDFHSLVPGWLTYASFSAVAIGIRGGKKRICHAAGAAF